MFARTTLVAILATLAAAQTGNISQDLAQLPSCALTCLISAIGPSGCSATDYQCQCTTGMAAISASATPCIVSGCSSADALKTQALTNDICAVQLGTSGSGSGSSSAAATSAAATSAAATSAAATTSAAAPATTMATSTAAAPATTTRAATSPVATTNAGNRNVIGAGVLGAAILAAIAL